MISPRPSAAAGGESAGTAAADANANEAQGPATASSVDRDLITPDPTTGAGTLVVVDNGPNDADPDDGTHYIEPLQIDGDPQAAGQQRLLLPRPLGECFAVRLTIEALHGAADSHGTIAEVGFIH